MVQDHEGSPRRQRCRCHTAGRHYVPTCVKTSAPSAAPLPSGPCPTIMFYNLLEFTKNWCYNHFACIDITVHNSLDILQQNIQHFQIIMIIGRVESSNTKLQHRDIYPVSLAQLAERICQIDNRGLGSNPRRNAIRLR